MDSRDDGAPASQLMAPNFIPGPSCKHAVIAQSVQVVCDRSIDFAIASVGHVFIAHSPQRCRTPKQDIRVKVKRSYNDYNVFFASKQPQVAGLLMVEEKLSKEDNRKWFFAIACADVRLVDDCHSVRHPNSAICCCNARPQVLDLARLTHNSNLIFPGHVTAKRVIDHATKIVHHVQASQTADSQLSVRALSVSVIRSRWNPQHWPTRENPRS